jgi:hypothetical protein
MLEIINTIKAQLVELGLATIGVISAILSLFPKNTWVGQKLDWMNSILGNLANWFKR